MAQSAKQYFEKLFRDAGMDEATMTAALNAIGHEKVASHADTIVKTATEDYNAQVGRVQALQAQMKQYSDWYGTASAEYQAMQAELNSLKSGGNGSSGNPPALDASKFMTKDDLAAYDKERAEKFASALKISTRLASRHAVKFGEELDVDAVDKIAQEKNIPLDVAYEQYVAPRVAQKQQDEFEARIKREKEEAVRDALSRHRLPVEPTPGEAAPIWSAKAAQNGSGGVTDDELLAAWNSAAKSQ